MAEDPNTTETETNTESERMARAQAHAESFLGRVHGDETDEPEAKPEPKEAKPEVETEELEAKEEEPVSPRLAAVVKAQQRAEAKLTAKEEALAKRESEISAKEEKLKAEFGGKEDFFRLLRRNPAKALELAGIKDREGWHRKAYYAELPPDKRPAHYDALERLSELDETLAERDKRLAELEEREKSREQAAKEAEERSANEKAVAEGVRLYREDLQKALDSLPKEMKWLPLLVADDKAAAVDAMYRAAESYFAEHGKPPTPAEAVALVEAAEAARMKPYEKHLTPNTTKPAAPNSTKAATRTLTAGKTATPTKPRPPATTEAERLARATEAAKGIWR